MRTFKAIGKILAILTLAIALVYQLYIFKDLYKILITIDSGISGFGEIVLIILNGLGICIVSLSNSD